MRKRKWSRGSPVADSRALKVEALCWLRFGKKLPYVCTEGGRWNADVLGLDDKHSVEVEVKVDKRDVVREFQTKSAKHHLYSSAGDQAVKHAPNYFYFYVPPELEAFTLETVEEKCPKAGVAVYEPSGGLDGKKTRVARRPTRLHDRPPSQQMRDAVLRRMGSELCGRHLAWQTFVLDLVEALAASEAKLVEAVKAISGTPDFEEEK